MVERLTREQAAIISVFTGISCCPFEDIKKLGDELMGRVTQTIEYGNEEFADRLKELCRDRFIGICFKG